MVSAISTPTISVDADAAALLDERAAKTTEAIADWARSHAAEYGVQLVGIRLRHWQSIEDPRSHDLIVDITVLGAAERALEFQDAVSDTLGQLVLRDPSPAARLLCTEVHWR
jgi:hypothetical protein